MDQPKRWPSKHLIVFNYSDIYGHHEPKNDLYFFARIYLCFFHADDTQQSSSTITAGGGGDRSTTRGGAVAAGGIRYIGGSVSTAEGGDGAATATVDIVSEVALHDSSSLIVYGFIGAARSCAVAAAAAAVSMH